MPYLGEPNVQIMREILQVLEPLQLEDSDQHIGFLR